MLGVVIPGGTCPEVDAVATVALGDENVCEEAVPASVGRHGYVMGAGSSFSDLPKVQEPPGRLWPVLPGRLVIMP